MRVANVIGAILLSIGAPVFLYGAALWWDGYDTAPIVGRWLMLAGAGVGLPGLLLFGLRKR